MRDRKRLANFGGIATKFPNTCFIGEIAVFVLTIRFSVIEMHLSAKF